MVFFKVALPRAVQLEAEEVDLVVEHFDVFSVARAPEAEYVFALVEQHLVLCFGRLRKALRLGSLRSFIQPRYAV